MRLASFCNVNYNLFLLKRQGLKLPSMSQVVRPVFRVLDDTTSLKQGHHDSVTMLPWWLVYGYEFTRRQIEHIIKKERTLNKLIGL